MFKKKILIFFILCEVPLAQGQSALPVQGTQGNISAEALTAKLPTSFQGILYNCEPLCRFISIKINQSWNPPLGKIKIGAENPSWILSSDPLYPLLVQSLPVKPYVLAQQGKESAQKKNEEKAPIPPPVPYDYGYSVGLGLRALSSQVHSNLVPQENVSPTSGIQSPTAQLSIFRLKPFYFLSRWWQLRGGYESDFPGASEMSTGSKINQSATDMHVDFLIMSDQAKWVLRTGQNMTHYQTDLNLLSAYSFQETWTWVGLGYIRQHFQLMVDYGLAVNLSEQQDFREQLQEARFYRLSAQWCSGTREAFDIKYGFCANLSKKHSATTSDIRSTFPLSDKFTLQTDENQLQLFLRFGDDFYL